MSDIINALLERVSSPKLNAPAPTPDQLELLLACAQRAPDHARLQPWHFTVIQGAGLTRLGDIFLAARRQDATPPDEREASKLLNMPLRAPMIIVAAARLCEHPKVPALEQVLAVGAAVQNLQLAARALGYGAMWRTGELARHPAVKAALGLAPNDEIVAFLYIGTPASDERPATRPATSTCVQYWND